MIALSILFFMLGARYDRVISAAGPRVLKEELEAQVEIKKQALADIDKQLAERTESMKNVANIDAEVRALTEQRDSLLAEHGILSERKEEIRQMDRDTEEAIRRFADAKRELGKKKEALDLIQAEYARAKSMVSESNRLQKEASALSSKVEELRSEKFELLQLKRDEENLRSEVSRLKDKEETAIERLQSLTAELDSMQAKRTELQSSLDEALVRKEVINSEVAQLEDKIRKLEENMRRGEAYVANLEAESKSGPSDENRLQDLTIPPECLTSSWPKKKASESEIKALDRLQKSLEMSGTIFSKRTIHAFHTSLKTALVSPLTVLAGISGTGKSMLPQRYADTMGMSFLKIPVQPRWDGPQDLFGFYNYIEKRFKATELARALVHMDPYNWQNLAERYENRILLVLLDEMNLARVEYYFSEFLSRLEGRPAKESEAINKARLPSELEIDLGPDNSDPDKEQLSKRVYVGQNVLFVGTMNEDESTLTLSDKVMDRANILRFSRPHKLQENLPEVSTESASGYLDKADWTKNWIRTVESLSSTNKHRASEIIQNINDVMDKLGRPYGHRMNQAMLHYVANYPNADNSVEFGLADQIEQRILPKLRGIDLESGKSHLLELANISEDDLKDTELAEAIKNTITLSGSFTSTFNWRGLQRKTD